MCETYKQTIVGDRCLPMKILTMLKAQKIFVNHSHVRLVTVLSIVQVKQSLGEDIHQSKAPFKPRAVNINLAIGFSERPVLLIDSKYKKEKID